MNFKENLEILKIKAIQKAKNQQIRLLNDKGKPLISFNDFNILMKEFAVIELLEKGFLTEKEADKFEFTHFNKEIIKILYLYAINHRAFIPEVQKNFTGKINIDNYQFSLNKDLFFIGRKGTGKTLLMTCFIKILNLNRYKKQPIFIENSRDFLKKIIINDKEFRSKALFVDDLGKEPQTYQEYGNTLYPMRDFLSFRYENNVPLFFTSNYNFETLKEKYGETIFDRLIQKYNFFVFYEKSNRK